ncbi:MAG: hypothetical protein M5U13_15505 [Thermoanaerobaculia bacterium]|nr:hypothetical protein [Thermoanaerobaculia bacterium]
MAKRSLAVISAVSDSIWEKSGWNVRSTTVSGLGSHLASTPPVASSSRSSSRPPGPPDAASIREPVRYGATTQWLPSGNPSRPTSGRTLQRKQLTSRGSREVKYW